MFFYQNLTSKDFVKIQQNFLFFFWGKHQKRRSISRYNKTRTDALIHVPLCKKHYEYSKNLKDEEKPMGWDYWDILDSLGGFLKI